VISDQCHHRALEIAHPASRIPYPKTCAQNGIIFEHKDSTLRPRQRPEEEAASRQPE
jgi:hypothetical protein